MALDLSALAFKVDTSELDRAGKAIGELVVNVGKLDKATKDAARTEATLAKAAKDSAKANLDNAKAQDVKVKSTLAVEQASLKAAAILERNTLLAQKEARLVAEAEANKVKAVQDAEAKKAKAREDASARAAKAEQAAMAAMAKRVKAEQDAINASTEKLAGILQRQKDILEFQTQGYSKGQSSVLAYGKAAGLAAADIGELGKVLETQRKLMGGDPFDKSLSGLKSLQNQYTELKESVRQYATDSNLSAKQTRELARDKERLIEKMKVEGASFSEIRAAVRAHNDEYVKLASSYNKMTSAEDAVIKSRKDAVTATNYLTQADQKMAAALNVSNASLDKAGTDSLVRYESALRKSGLAQDVVTQKLSTYKVQLAQVQAQETKRREQHLARAAAPQLTDIGVSLYSGQAPMTVLLQQSGQLVDLLNLSGVEASKFGDILRTSFYSMVPAIKQVTLGIAGLVGGLFMDAGSAVSRFVGNVTGITAAMEIAKRAIVSGGEENFKYVASLEKVSKAAAATAAGGIAALILVVALLALEYKKIIQAESDLSKALATSGGALGLTRDQAVAAAEGMSSLGVGTLKAMSAFTEIAKAGSIGKSSLELVTKAAVDLEKTAGVSIEETAKQYAKLQEEPAKALIEIAQKTGLVDKETLAYVASLERQGDKTEAARVATLALSSAHAQVASEIKDNWSPVEVLWNDIKSAIEGVKQEIYDLATSNAAVGAMRTVWETISVVISEVWFTIKGVGKEIGGIGAQIAAVMRGDFSGAASIGEQMKVDAESAAAAQKKFVASILDRSTVEQKSFNQSKEQNSQYAKWLKENDQALDKSISKEDKYKAKQLEVQKAVLAGTVSQTEANKALDGWKKIIYGDSKPKKDPSENYFAALMREATNNTIKADNATQGLTKSELKLLEVKSDSRFEKLTADQKAQVAAKYENAAATEKLAEAEKQRSKIEDDALEGALKTIDRNKEIEDSYDAAKEAALEYIDTLRLQAKRENEGVGKGTSYRSGLSGLNGIEDKFNTKQSSLAKSKGTKGDYWYEKELALARSTYEQEVEIYKKSIADKNAAQGDWTNGAKEALANYLSETENVAKATENLFTKAFKGMEDAMVEFVKTGKLDFSSLADSLISDLIRIQVQKNVMPMLSGGFDSAVSWVGSLFSANGNAFDGSGQVQKFANGGTFTNQIVDQPTPFKFAKGTGIMGEAGPEAIMPLSRGSDGKLGVQASGGGGNNVIVQVIESPGKGGQQTRTNENGTDVITVFVEQIKTSLAADIRKGSGAVPDAMSQTYGLNRVAGAY